MNEAGRECMSLNLKCVQFEVGKNVPCLVGVRLPRRVKDI